jgi:two-component system response regulator (stage 0 sporulation protein F)
MQLNGKLLVVDDEEVMREFLLEVFASYGPLEASDGKQALQIVESQDVALIISDLKMPGMDGLELLRRIKEQQDGIKVIIVTGYASAKTASDCLAAGAAAFLTKPFSISQIVRAVEQVAVDKGTIK